MQIAHRLRKAIWLPFAAVGVVWFVSLASLYKFIKIWNYPIPFEIETEKWWTNGLGSVYLEGIRVYESGKKETFIAGDFLVRYKPWEIFFGDHFDIKITGRNISSEYLKQLIAQDSSASSDFIEKLKAELIVSSDGSLVVKKAEARGSLGEGTATGSLDSNGTINMQSAWIVDRAMKKFLPNDAALAIADPTKIQCFLQGNIEHPSVRLVSDYFQIELG